MFTDTIYETIFNNNETWYVYENGYAYIMPLHVILTC